MWFNSNERSLRQLTRYRKRTRMPKESKRKPNAREMRCIAGARRRLRSSETLVTTKQVYSRKSKRTMSHRLLVRTHSSRQGQSLTPNLLWRSTQSRTCLSLWIIIQRNRRATKRLLTSLQQGSDLMRVIPLITHFEERRLRVRSKIKQLWRQKCFVIVESQSREKSPKSSTNC